MRKADGMEGGPPRITPAGLHTDYLRAGEKRVT